MGDSCGWVGGEGGVAVGLEGGLQAAGGHRRLGEGTGPGCCALAAVPLRLRHYS